MEIANRNTYYNSIFSAIVVNSNTDLDPLGLGRVQLYIPSIHLDYADIYTTYLTSEDKEHTDGWSKFPWAITLVTGLENGNVVYGSNINNKNNEYIVLGLDVYNNANSKSTSSNLDISSNVSGLLDITMPIIIHNEIGIATTDWPDNISDSKYTKITPYDNGGWSIGLIQWHHCRAFDCLYQIAQSDTNWRNYWSNKQLDLYLDLEKSIKTNSTTGYRTKYQDNFHPTVGTDQYEGIKKMLGSDIGKQTQKTLASIDTSTSLETLMGNPYNISNPAVLIFLADIMNQYGANLPNTIKKASSICASSGDIMSQLNEFRDWCKTNLNKYNTYITRRNNTYTYIENLYNSGKLSVGTTLTDVNNTTNNTQLLWPSPDCHIITSKYGNRTYYSTKYKTWVKDFHTGVDLSKSGGSYGYPIIAAHSGTVATKDLGGVSYGTLTTITNGSMTTYYAHQSRRAVGIVNGAKVQAGQVIGYIGNTGNSSGAHLHFEIRLNGKHVDPLPYIQKS